MPLLSAVTPFVSHLSAVTPFVSPDVQIYLEPGEAIVTKTTDLVVEVVDITWNEKSIAIVDSATEAHRLDS